MIKEANVSAAACGDIYPIEDLLDGFYPGAMRAFFATPTLPAFLTGGEGVELLIDYCIQFTDAGGNQCVAHGSTYNDGVVVDMVLKVKDYNVDLTKGAGVTLVKGWVDYTPKE
jgi:hypothetical protein